MDIEARSVDTAAHRLRASIGIDALQTRLERHVHGDTAAVDRGALVGRTIELVLDGSLVVWRGEWVREGEIGERWESWWLVPPERIATVSATRRGFA